jgi:L-threonylcarbamoyladenylate synthase
MTTIVEKYDDRHPDPDVMARARAILRNGGLVALPTETVYGLGGDALNPEASAKIYAAKGRPSDNPLIIHIADMEALKVLTREVPEKALLLADRFWPGPLTMIMPKSEKVPYTTTGGLDTVAVRMPSHPTAYELIRSSGVYIAAPSANTSGRPSPTRAEHVLEDLNGKIDMIIDSGKVEIGLESTIVDLTGDIPTILRPGFITKEMLEAVVGPVMIDPAILAENQNLALRPKAPGMSYRHYAPKGKLLIVEGKREAVADTINRLTEENEAQGLKTAVIVSEENMDLYTSSCKMNIGSREDEKSIGANLYDVLRQMDEQGIERIYSESFAGGALGAAIMNRLLKSAGYHVLRV